MGPAARAAPPGRAARAGVRGRAPGLARGARPAGRRLRTCTRRCSRTTAIGRTARLTASRRRSPECGAAGCRPGLLAGPAGRTRPAGTRGTSRAGSGTSRSGSPRPSGPRRVDASARAACAHRRGGAATAGRGRHSRGNGRRRAPSHPARARPGPRCARDRGTAARRWGRLRDLRAGAGQCRRPSRWRTGPRPGVRAARRRLPAPTARALDRRTASARRRASRRARRGSAPRRSSDRWAPRRWRLSARRGRPTGCGQPARPGCARW